MAGYNMMQVAAHEMGHTLGLRHSRVDSALMAPFYKRYTGRVELQSDDKAGIRNLYGKVRYTKIQLDNSTNFCSSPGIIHFLPF